MGKDFRNFINGSVYGMTLIIPGVSATIFAIILNFYDELLHTMNNFRANPKTHGRYLIVFVVGCAFGAVAFSSLTLYLLTNFSVPTMLFFIGLLTGVIPLIYSRAKDTSKRIAPKETLFAAVSFAALIALTFGEADTAPVPVESASNISIALIMFVLIAGLINGATLVVPGLSGALILLLMGLYPLVIYSVSCIGVFLGNPGNVSLLVDICAVLAPFGIGAIIGLLAMARIMEKLLRDYKKAAYSLILGLIIASVISLLQNPLVYQSGISAFSVTIGVLTFCAGCAGAYVMGKRA